MARQNINVRLGIFIALAAVLLALPSSPAWAAQPYRPELRIAESNGNVTLSWPREAYYYALVGKTNFNDQGAWSGIATTAAAFSNAIPFLGGLDVATNFAGDAFNYNVTATKEQSYYGLVGLRYIPLCQFAIFYQGLLEFSTTAAVTYNGPIHANGNIYTGTSASLTFNRPVTTAGTISSPPWNGQGPGWNDTGTFTGTPAFVTNVVPFEVRTAGGFTNLHEIIDMPPVGEDPASSPGGSRYYNQAQIVVLVSNTTVSARIQAASAMNNPGSDPAPIYLWTNLGPAMTFAFPFLTTNSFYDARESKVVQAIQIDLGRYKLWLGTNASVLAKFHPGLGAYPAILYIADKRTNTSAAMSAIRITNGMALPYNGGVGFTLVTPNPLYVWGNYNCTNLSHLGTTNTFSAVRSALICDALTVLSGAWRDSGSSASLSARVSSSTNTLNAAIIAGNVPSTGSSSSQFSGGVHNLVRLLENWSASTLWINGSFACLYPSTVATIQFQNPGVYFNPPTRKFAFDQSFANSIAAPPGCPIIGVPDPNE